MAHPLDLAGGIMFSGCSSVCACVRTFMPGGGLLPSACRQRLFYSFYIFVIFTARCYASAVPAMGLCPCLCLSLCLSVTSRCSTKTAKRRITQTTPHDTPATLVFWCQRSPRNSTGVTPYEGAECRWGCQNRRLSTHNRLYLENGKR